MAVTTVGLGAYVNSDDPTRIFDAASRWDTHPRFHAITLTAVVLGVVAVLVAMAMASAFPRRSWALGALAVTSLALALEGYACIVNTVD